MSSAHSKFIHLPEDHAGLRTQWPVKVTRSTTTPDYIATIETPQKTIEARHVDQAQAVAKCGEAVREAELRGEVAANVFG